MAKGQLTKNWTITPNVRYTPFVSLNAAMGWFLYQHKTALLAAGWTIVGSSDGMTGALDAVDRWPSQSVGPVTRAATDILPQSWAVLQNVDGVQVLFAYQGAADDVARISMSMGGVFIVALVDPARQPTATDEVLVSSVNSVINATASGDRLLQLGCTTESWWSATYRATVLQQFMGVEKIDPACSTTVLAKPYVSLKYNNFNTDTGLQRVMGGSTNVAIGASGWMGVGTRVFVGSFMQVRCGGGRIAMPLRLLNNQGADVTFFPTSITPPLQDNSRIMLLPVHWFGHTIEDPSGYLGSPIDWWWSVGVNNTQFVQGDMVAGLDVGDTQATPLRSNWLVVFGGACIRPWRNAAASMQTA